MEKPPKIWPQGCSAKFVLKYKFELEPFESIFFRKKICICRSFKSGKKLGSQIENLQIARKRWIS
jgi:hypothetical protein